MGRYFSGAGGGIGAGGSVTPAIVTTVTTGEDVQQGDIITVGDDALAYWAADPTSGAPLNLLRPVSNPVSQAGVVLNATPIRPRTGVWATPLVALTGAPALGATSYDAAQMSNGNIVAAWVSPTSAAVMGAVFDPSSGAQIGDTQVLDVISSTTPTILGPVLSLDALAGGGFAISYYVAHPVSGGVMKYAVFDSTMAPILAPTVADPGVRGSNGSSAVTIWVRRLSSGGFVIALMSQNDLIQAVRTYDAKGGLTGGPFSLGSSASGGSWGIHCDSFTASQGGGFVVAYYNQAGLMVRKFSNTCAPLMDASSVKGYNSQYCRVACLSTGGFAVAMTNGTVNTYGANCKEIVANVPFMVAGDAADVYPPAICAHADGNFAVFCFGNKKGTGFARISGVTGQVLALGPTAVSAAWNSNVVSMIAPLKDGGSVVIAGGAFWVLDASANLVASSGFPTTIYAAQGAPGVLKPISNTLKKTDLFLLMTQSLSLALISGYLQPCSPLGVAAASAVAGGAVPVQITGNANCRLSFAKPYAVDATIAPIPGQRMAVVGNMAILQGVQVATRNGRPIN